MKPSIAVVLCAVCVACGDQEVPDSPSSLVAAVAEPAGANCAAGGEAIESGVDTNGNGILDTSEVTATSYVCSAVSGSPGSATLVDVVAEPAGAHCANGGQAIETGVDANGNGVLDPSEVAQTSYICAGANGAEPLLRIDVETAGAHCSAGGSAIHVGIDTNGDHILEDSEIESTTYMCRAANATTIDGSFTVNNSVDAAQLVGVTTITGNLTLSAVGLTAIDLSALQTVGGTVAYTGFSGAVLSMPALTSAGGIVVTGPLAAAPLDVPVLASVGPLTFAQTVLTTATFPALTNITTLTAVDDIALTTLSLPVLTALQNVAINNCGITALDLSHVTTAQQFTLTQNPNLTSLSLSLTSIGGLRIAWDTAITSLDLSSLATVQSLDIQGLVAMTSIDFSSLASVGSQMQVTSDTALTALAFPVLTSVGGTNGWLQLDYNTALASISAPVWTTVVVVDFEFYGNSALPTCQIQALADQMNAQNRYIYANNDGASCP